MLQHQSFDTWVMRWLGQYYTFWTQSNSMHRLPLWIPTLQGICGLTRQKWNLQQNPQGNTNSWYNKELYSFKIIPYFSLLSVRARARAVGVLRRERQRSQEKPWFLLSSRSESPSTVGNSGAVWSQQSINSSGLSGPPEICNQGQTDSFGRTLWFHWLQSSPWGKTGQFLKRFIFSNLCMLHLFFFSGKP